MKAFIRNILSFSENFGINLVGSAALSFAAPVILEVVINFVLLLISNLNSISHLEGL